ncbi:hypothetical protein MMC14_001976 [Varicellaria rhodocarpa]|nr:hypothetical protein [Varicellaria rhodocarpa]
MNFPAEWSLEAAIGAKIRLTSSIPAINGLEGLIASASPSNDLLILKAPSSAANSDSGNKTPLKMVSIAAIHSVSLLAPPSPAQTQTRNLPTTDTLNVEALQTRLGANITNLKGEDARRGKGVTPEAQHLFDAMSRTMATRWEGTDIVVTDAVIIPSPYRPEDCKLIPGIQGSASLALPRIRQVLGKERFRLLNKEQAKLGMLPIVPAVPSQVEKKGG